MQAFNITVLAQILRHVTLQLIVEPNTKSEGLHSLKLCGNDKIGLIT
jgi:hypothetical protein